MSKKNNVKCTYDLLSPESDVYIYCDDMRYLLSYALNSLSYSASMCSEALDNSSIISFDYQEFYFMFYKRVKFLERDILRYLEKNKGVKS